MEAERMRLPPINALRALDGVARHANMTRAAQELHLTPSAVSHALAQLELELGFELTAREGRRLELTRAGRLYAREVRRALTLLADAKNVAKESSLNGRFTLSCSPGLGMFWLIQNIAQFRNLFPHVDLRIATPEEFEAVAAPDVDLFIAYGAGSWRGYESEKLTELEYAPYCSPVLLNALGGLSDAADLQRYPLLHLRDYDDWTRWLSAAKVDNLVAESGIVMSNMSLVLSATLEGVGVAIGDNISCRKALAEGLLVRPFSLSMRSTEAYYFVNEPSKRDLPISSAFRQWVRTTLNS
jgi:LysR family glycine cleavage system transcriptional activator